MKDVQGAAEQRLAQKLGDTLSLLLPGSAGLFTSIMRLVNQAVTLANQMTEEQAIFRCFFPMVGEPTPNANIRVPDERQTGRVFMCIFPGFCRRVILDDGNESRICILKANAVLESAFIKDRSSSLARSEPK